MEPIHLSYSEFYLYIAVIGAALGVIFGLVPLILGRRRHQGKLGLIGFAASIVAGAIAPLLSIIVVAVFVWLILRKKDETAGTQNGENSQGSPS